jgi:micrococcal nuclease
MYEYNATVQRVIDGDTVLLDVDLGFFTHMRMSCRLTGINAREMHDAGGPQAKAHLEKLLPVETKVMVESVKADKYAGRFDAYIYPYGSSGKQYIMPSVNELMVQDGYAALWSGTGPAPVPPWPILTP